MTGYQHANRASMLLGQQDDIEQQLNEMTEEQAVNMAASGGTARLNANRKFAVELATAHALTSIALQMPQMVKRGSSVNR